jgi:hypothetical protein
MANQLHIYTNNPTAGKTDGTEASSGTGLTPISVTLDASQAEAKAVKCAVRCDTGYYIEQYFPQRKVRFIAVNEGYDLADWTIDLPQGNVFNVSIGAFAPLLYEYLGGRTDMAAIMQLRGYEIDGSASTLSVTIQFPVLLQCDGNTKCPMDLHSVLLEQLAYAVDDAYKAAARAELAAAAVPEFSKTHMSMASMDSFLATLGAQLNCTYTRTWDEAQGVWVFTATPL